MSEWTSGYVRIQFPADRFATVEGALSDTITTIEGVDYRVVTWTGAGSINIKLTVEYVAAGGVS